MPTETQPVYTVHYGISVRMLGPNGGGHGARRGHVMHAVERSDFINAFGVAVVAIANEALCGYSPSYEWSEKYDTPVTCPKCLRKLAKAAK